MPYSAKIVYKQDQEVILSDKYVYHEFQIERESQVMMYI